MKKIFSNIRTMAALLMAGAAFAACSSSDDIIENQQPANNGKQAYTLTINASKDGAATRALTVDNGAIVASWETTDVIYVTKGTTEIGTLSPTDISGLEATFTGTISGDAQIDVDDVLTLTYHPVADFATQNGTLSGSANSAENYDMAVATVTISAITGNTITVSESQANFVNQTAVVVLSPYNSSWSEYHSLNSLTVSVTMDIPEVGTVTEKIGPITVTGDQPHYFSLPSQSLLAEVLAAKYSVSASTFTTLLASATITFTGHQTGDDYDREYLTCSKTGYKFAAGKYYKLDNSNFSMTMLYKRAVADKDVYVESQDVSWSHTVTFAVNKEIGWKVVGDYVFCGDKQLYVVDNSGPEPSEGWVRASDDHIPFDATYTLVTPIPAATVTTAPTATTGNITLGSTTALVTAGEAEGGTMMYKVTTSSDKPASTDGFSATVPTAEGLAIGTYYVWYYVQGDASHTDSEISATGIQVTVNYPLLSEATASDYGKVVCNNGHLHPAKTEVTGCTAVAVFGYISGSDRYAIALQDAEDANWNTITNSGSNADTNCAVPGTWTVAEPDGANWYVATQPIYSGIFQGLEGAFKSTLSGSGYTYDDTSNAFITDGEGGCALSGSYWTTTLSNSMFGGTFDDNGFSYPTKTNSNKVRPVLKF